MLVLATSLGLHVRKVDEQRVQMPQLLRAGEVEIQQLERGCWATEASLMLMLLVGVEVAVEDEAQKPERGRVFGRSLGLQQC
jgi:hypothetical protein